MFGSKTSVAALSVASNLTLTILKLVVGISIGSISVTAEAIHSGVDLLASVIALFAVRASGRPPDEKYQFGRGKVENVSGTIEAILIFGAAALIIYEAVSKLQHGMDMPGVDLGLVVMGISVVANVLVSRQLFSVARKTDSVALEADAYHLTTDIMTSIGVFVGLIAVRITGLPWLDPVAALGVALLIIKAAWDITRRSAVDLLDRSLPENEQKLIVETLAQHEGLFVGFHAVRTRKAGAERHVDLHLVLSGTTSVAKAHQICDHLEEDLGAVLDGCSVTIHTEPCEEECTTCEIGCNQRQQSEGLGSGF